MPTIRLEDVLRATGEILNKNPHVDSLADAGFNRFTDINSATADPREIAIKGTGQEDTQIVEYDPVDPQLLRDSYEVRKRIADLKALKNDKQLSLTNELRNKYGLDQLEAELDQYTRLGSMVNSPAIIQRANVLQQSIDARKQALEAEVVRKTASGFNQIDHEIDRLSIRQDELADQEKLESAIELQQGRKSSKELLAEHQAERMMELVPPGKNKEDVVKDLLSGNISPAVIDIYSYESQTGNKMSKDEIVIKHGKQGAEIAGRRYKNNNPGPITPENKAVLQFYERTGELVDRITPESIEQLAKESESEETKTLQSELLQASGVKEKDAIRQRAATQMRMEAWRQEKGRFQERVLETEMKPENFLLDNAPIATDAEKEAARWILTNFPDILDYDPDTRKMADRWNSVRAIVQGQKEQTFQQINALSRIRANVQGEFPADADLFNVRRKMITAFIADLRRRYSAMESGIIDPANSRIHAIMIGGLR